jgi:hypothetical protein
MAPKMIPGTKEKRKASGALLYPSPLPGFELYFQSSSKYTGGPRPWLGLGFRVRVRVGQGWSQGWS